jgi:hypothetical protein
VELFLSSWSLENEVKACLLSKNTRCIRLNVKKCHLLEIVQLHWPAPERKRKIYIACGERSWFEVLNYLLHIFSLDLNCYCH